MCVLDIVRQLRNLDGERYAYRTLDAAGLLVEESSGTRDVQGAQYWKRRGSVALRRCTNAWYRA